MRKYRISNTSEEFECRCGEYLEKGDTAYESELCSSVACSESCLVREEQDAAELAAIYALHTPCPPPGFGD
jgi:hypothetical protein